MNKLYPFKIFASLILILIFSGRSVLSQTVYPLPTSERRAVFFFQEWGITKKDNPKVLLISSYIYRFNPKSEKHNSGTGLGYDRFETALQLSANKKTKEIDFDERISGKANFEQLSLLSTPEKEWAFFNPTSKTSTSTGPNLYKVFSNATVHLSAVRERILNEYIEKGYKIFQLDLSRDMENFPFDSDEIERVEKLNPRWIEEYYVGSIRYIARISETAKSNSGNQKNKISQETKKEIALYDYCWKEYRYVESLINKARSGRSYYAWKDAEKAFNNYNCSKVPLNALWKQEIDKGLQNTQVAEAASGVVDLLTSSPWTYGYGKFIGADKSYLHRFIINFSGTYSDKVFSSDLSIFTNIMRFPLRTVNYTFVPTSGSGWSGKKSKTFDDIKPLTASIGQLFTLWPNKHIFIQALPEIHIGANTLSTSSQAPVKDFTTFPALNGIIGFRLGPVYLSGTYGTIWKTFEVNKNSKYASEDGSYNL